MPHAKGKATVTVRRGVTWIDAKFERVETPQQFGRQYLTYVLWALSPDGRAANLGELILDPSDEGQSRVDIARWSPSRVKRRKLRKTRGRSP